MDDKILIIREDVKFLLYLLKRHIKDKDGVLQECYTEDEKQHWDNFFCVTESKEVLKRVEEAYKDA